MKPGPERHRRRWSRRYPIRVGRRDRSPGLDLSLADEAAGCERLGFVRSERLDLEPERFAVVLDDSITVVAAARIVWRAVVSQPRITEDSVAELPFGYVPIEHAPEARPPLEQVVKNFNR
jgi:hypothetical protein